MYPSIYGGIECCACRLAPLVNTIFTKGPPEGEEDSRFYKFMGVKGPCPKCKGKGCDSCMMHGSLTFFSRSEAIQHLKEHVAADDQVPNYALARLDEELAEIGDTEGLEKPEVKPSPLVVLTKDGGKRLSKEEADELIDG
jgi:hypothetical protein